MKTQVKGLAQGHLLPSLYFAALLSTDINFPRTRTITFSPTPKHLTRCQSIASNQNIPAVFNWTVCQARAQRGLCNCKAHTPRTRQKSHVKTMRFQVIFQHVNPHKKAFHKQKIRDCISIHPPLLTLHGHSHSNIVLCS